MPMIHLALLPEVFSWEALGEFIQMVLASAFWVSVTVPPSPQLSSSDPLSVLVTGNEWSGNERNRNRNRNRMEKKGFSRPFCYKTIFKKVIFHQLLKSSVCSDFPISMSLLCGRAG